jgi:hypothetical protein
VNDPHKIGLPQNPPAVTFSFFLDVGGEMLTVRRPLIYKWVDPVKGELWRPFEIVPALTLSLSESVLIFSNRQPRSIKLFLKSSMDENISGKATLELPAGWTSEPASIPFELTGRGSEQVKSVVIHPTSAEFDGTIKAVAEVNGKKYGQSLQLISYDHFPAQTLLPVASTKAVRIDLKKEGNIVGYIKGAGDDIPAALRNMGYQVIEMSNDEINDENLSRMDAVVLGVRALNTNERARYFMPAVLDYVKGGGTVIVQYNTNSRMDVDRFSPYPLKLGRDRVTEENAPVRILKPSHAVINTPNKITPEDFNGWVQERGLYFPVEWAGEYEAVLSMNDTGETAKDGSLLVAKYGEGYYVYTALSFFRELPEGVPGAFKLFANLVSLGKNKKHEPVRSKERSK